MVVLKKHKIEISVPAVYAATGKTPVRGVNAPQPDEGEILYIPKYIPNWSREHVQPRRTDPSGLHTAKVQPTTRI